MNENVRFFLDRMIGFKSEYLKTSLKKLKKKNI